MTYGFEDFQRLQKDNIETAVKSFGAYSKGVQAIAVEVADYSKKNFEETTAAAEKLFAARTLDKAVEVQSEYIRQSYEGLVAQLTKIGELYVDLAKDAYKPFEAVVAKASTK